MDNKTVKQTIEELIMEYRQKLDEKTENIFDTMYSDDGLKRLDEEATILEDLNASHNTKNIPDLRKHKNNLRFLNGAIEYNVHELLVVIKDIKARLTYLNRLLDAVNVVESCDTLVVEYIANDKESLPSIKIVGADEVSELVLSLVTFFSETEGYINVNVDSMNPQNGTITMNPYSLVRTPKGAIELFRTYLELDTLPQDTHENKQGVNKEIMQVVLRNKKKLDLLKNIDIDDWVNAHKATVRDVLKLDFGVVIFKDSNLYNDSFGVYKHID